MTKILLFFAIASCTAFAQITITSGDVANMFAVGNTATIHEDSTQSSVDIGSPGGGNNWDFTMLVSILSVSLESVNPATTPFIGDFTGADIATKSVGFSGGFQAEIWSYSTLNGIFGNMGNVIDVASPPLEMMIKNNPARITFELPMTMSSQWQQTFTQTQFMNGIQMSQATVAIDIEVDAYGSMTLPGGQTFEALRLKEETTFTIPPNPPQTWFNYTFVSLSGAQVSVFAPDNVTPPVSGIIDVESTSYNGALTTSGVEQISGLPEEYSLSQNYPNPFNPTTLIEYSIPEASFVELKVYDVLGNEIATLVNQEQSAGVYRADFSGNGLASGLYIARITSGSYTNSIKMILMK